MYGERQVSRNIGIPSTTLFKKKLLFFPPQDMVIISFQLTTVLRPSTIKCASVDLLYLHMSLLSIKILFVLEYKITNLNLKNQALIKAKIPHSPLSR